MTTTQEPPPGGTAGAAGPDRDHAPGTSNPAAGSYQLDLTAQAFAGHVFDQQLTALAAAEHQRSLLAHREITALVTAHRRRRLDAALDASHYSPDTLRALRDPTGGITPQKLSILIRETTRLSAADKKAVEALVLPRAPADTTTGWARRIREAIWAAPIHVSGCPGLRPEKFA